MNYENILVYMFEVNKEKNKESIYILKILILDVTLDHLALQANIRS